MKYEKNLVFFIRNDLFINGKKKWKAAQICLNKKDSFFFILRIREFIYCQNLYMHLVLLQEYGQ